MVTLLELTVDYDKYRPAARGLQVASLVLTVLRSIDLHGSGCDCRGRWKEQGRREGCRILVACRRCSCGSAVRGMIHARPVDQKITKRTVTLRDTDSHIATFAVSSVQSNIVGNVKCTTGLFLAFSLNQSTWAVLSFLQLSSVGEGRTAHESPK